MKIVILILAITGIILIIIQAIVNYVQSRTNVYVKKIAPDGVTNLHFSYFPYKHGDLVKFSGDDFFYEVDFTLNKRLQGLPPTLYKYVR